MPSMNRFSLCAVVTMAGCAMVALARPASTAQPAEKSGGGKVEFLPPKERPSIEKFLKIRTPGSPRLLDDGTMFVVDWPDGINQLYRVSGGKADAKENKEGGPFTRLTSFKDGISGFTVSPDGKRILVSAGVGGNENTQIYALASDAPGPDAVKALVNNPKVQYAVNVWLADSSGFLFSGNDKSPSDFYIYRYDFAPGGEGKVTPILAKEGSWSAADITRDGTRALVQEYKSASDSRVYELDISTGTLTELMPTEKPLAEGQTLATRAVGYLPDESSVLLSSDLIDGRQQLFVRDLKTGRVGQPIQSLASFELDDASMNPERTMLAAVTNQDGYGVVTLYKLPDYSPIILPPMEKGVVGLTHFSGQRLVWTMSNARRQGVGYTYTVPTDVANRARVQATQLTFSDTQGIALEKFRLPELVKYKSFDGLEIPAFLYMPENARRGEPVPFIVNYHGGPEGQSRPSFSAVSQYFVASGYGMIMPNVRGSTGYGRAFQMMDDYKNRMSSVKDGVEAARWLVREGYATPGKIAAYGGSYGGYMSVATIVEDGGSEKPVFGASIDIVGIVNLKTFLEQTSGYRRKLREVEYGPLSDPAFLESVSPIFKANQIKVPMLIGHGENDPRVPVGEAKQLAAELERRSQEPGQAYLKPELIIFPDEGHGFAKLQNRLVFYTKAVEFLDRTIGSKAAPAK